ncbi:MAG: 5,10-methylenetetrahydromethanopterin reductase [Hyphomicrobiaceae bacterium]|jgi:5,10-methylenetetrahydromethanopterin reductase
MRLGVVVGGSDSETLDEAVDALVAAEKAGFHSAWRANIFGLDALTVLALAGARTSRIELGTAVVPTYPRHPHALAQQAATTNAATNGRLVLGIGRSHQVVIESMFGLQYDKPITHMREYVAVLKGLFDDGAVSLDGKQYKVHAPLTVPGGAKVPVMIGALMPKMLELCGTLCDGTLTWMSGPGYIAKTVVPCLRAASEKAGREMPRVVVSLPVCVTDDKAAAHAFAAKQFEIYGTLPVYRACLDAEGAAGPADVALIGSEDEVRAGLEKVKASGASDFYAGVFPESAGADTARTSECLAGIGAAL